ncbi:mkkA [Symbiodinium sp. CCMP2592]|nr:mkkA [Symbiodinium sp. CCMP2592]
MAYKNDKSWKVPPRQANSVQTLSTSLQLLSKEDPDKLIIVRRINKLGFKASRKLKQYFGECKPQSAAGCNDL